MVDLFKSVFDEEMFADLYYVEENPAVVRTINISKVDGHVVSEELEKTFKLDRIAGEDAYELKHRFFVKLNFLCRAEERKYFNRGLIGRLFGYKSPQRIVEMITEFDWVIISRDVLAELKQTDEMRNAKLTELVDEGTELRPVGNLLGVNIHLIPEDIEQSHGCKGIIYGGFRKSMTPVVHRTEDLYWFEVEKEHGIKKYRLL